VLSAALAVSTVCRIVWGSLADRLGLRRALVAMGALMAAAAFASTGVSAAWPGLAIVALASLFGISAFCWAGVAFAETVRHVPAELVPEAAAAAVTFTFAGALAGPAVFSSVVAATGRYGPAFIALGVLAALATIVLLVAGIADARTVALEETPTRR